MAREFRQSSFVSSDMDSRELLSIVESAISGLSKDVDRYYFKEREFQNFRFMITFVVFAVYAALAIMFFTVMAAGVGTGGLSALLESQSSAPLFSVFVLLVGAPIMFSQLVRTRESLRTLRTIRRHIDLQVGYAEETLKRVTDWEAELSSRDFVRPILKLRISMLMQLVEEMRLIGSKREVSLKLF